MIGMPCFFAYAAVRFGSRPPTAAMMTSGCDLAGGKIDNSLQLSVNVICLIFGLDYAIQDVPSKPSRRASDLLTDCGGWSTIQTWRMKLMNDPILKFIKEILSM
jgi:hypothetical protein